MVEMKKYVVIEFSEGRDVVVLGRENRSGVDIDEVVKELGEDWDGRELNCELDECEELNILDGDEVKELFGDSDSNFWIVGENSVYYDKVKFDVDVKEVKKFIGERLNIGND